MANRRTFSAFAPFCIAEWVYQKKGSKDLYRLRDASLLDPLLLLRTSYSHLTAASAIARNILASQMSLQSAPNLYALLQSYLQRLAQFDNPNTLSLSFVLKLLTHEGLLSIRPQCALCNNEALAIKEGESLCHDHSSLQDVFFSSEEWKTVLLLTHAKQFSLLQQIEISDPLEEKITESVGTFFSKK